MLRWYVVCEDELLSQQTSRQLVPTCRNAGEGRRKLSGQFQQIAHLRVAILAACFHLRGHLRKKPKRANVK